MKKLIALSLAVTLAACDLTITTDGGNSSSTNNTGSPTSPSPTNPTPVPNPTPNSGNRTPDPPAGSYLPLPTYANQVISNVTTPLGNPCAEFNFLDSVVDQLRLQDTRWGYVCGNDCVSPRRDKIAYHATAGPDVAGALGVWILDIIGNACDASQFKTYQVIGYDPKVGWTTRGRF